MVVTRSLYSTFYYTLGESDLLVSTIGGYLVFLITLIVANAPFVVSDLYGPDWIRKYRVQTTKNCQIDRKGVKRHFKNVAFNAGLLNLISAYPWYEFQRLAGIKFHPSNISSWQWFMIEIPIFFIIQDCTFYHIHRFIHHPKLYSYVHKQHHEWTAPISLTAYYSSSTEHIFTILSAWAGALIMGAHITSAWVWLIMSICLTTVNHSGYCLPFWPETQRHDYHHESFNWNYGSGLFDTLYGTDAKFRRDKKPAYLKKE